MTIQPTPKQPMDEAKRRGRALWEARPQWLVPVLFVALMLSAISGIAQYVQARRQPLELLEDARAIVPSRWIETTGQSIEGGWPTSVDEGFVEAAAPTVLPQKQAVDVVIDTLARRGCTRTVNKVGHPHFSVEGRCGPANFKVNFETAERLNDVDLLIDGLTIRTQSSFAAAFYSAALAGLASFLLLGAPAIGFAIHNICQREPRPDSRKVRG